MVIKMAIENVRKYMQQFGIEDRIMEFDVSFRKYDMVFPACGSSNSAIELTIEEMEKYIPYTEWVDVCKESV